MPFREILSSSWDRLAGFQSDQQKGIPAPEARTVPSEGATVAGLPEPSQCTPDALLAEVIDRRRSRRSFTPAPLTASELSFLLWATQGLQRTFGHGASLRTVPSGGARHPFDTLLAVDGVEGIDRGLYRYLPFDHALLLEAPHPGREAVTSACNGQSFVGNAPVVFIWVAVTARTSWRYGPASGKLIALDAGHLCQNLYLACEALGLGTCAIGAYLQDEIDSLLGLDGEERMVVYLAPVGRPADG